MLENLNKSKYIVLTSSVCEELSAEIEAWITKCPRSFEKWDSPFGELECEVTSSGFGDGFLHDADFVREILVAAWRRDAPFYKGEIWHNEPDVIIEYSEADNLHQPTSYFYNWRVYVRSGFLNAADQHALRQSILISKLAAETHPSDKLELLDEIEWGQAS